MPGTIRSYWATIFSGFSLLVDCNCLSDDCGGLLTIVRRTGYIENNVYPAQVQGCFSMQIINFNQKCACTVGKKNFESYGRLYDFGSRPSLLDPEKSSRTRSRLILQSFFTNILQYKSANVIHKFYVIVNFV